MSSRPSDTTSSISRRQALKSLGGLLASAAVPASEALAAAPQAAKKPRSGKKKSSRPNILWITGEGVPVSALSCYGSQLLHTPNIDRIANEGVRFDNAFTTNALCAPSRATLLTGTYTHANGMIANPNNPHATEAEKAKFHPTDQLMPALLRAQGYQTGMVGKWHLPVSPADCGFDYFVYKEGAGGPYYKEEGYLGNPHLGSRETQRMHFEGYITDVMTDLTIKGMQQFTQPFMMMLQFFNAHRPFEPPHKYEHIYDDVRIPEPATFWDDYSHRCSAAGDARIRIENMPDFHPPADLTPRQRKQWNYQRLMQHFLGTVRAQDDNIGRIFDFLETSGLADNTIIIYTCDHGFFLGDHGWFDKRFMYEQALRVPFMVRRPDEKNKGAVRKSWTVNIDNAPTALALAGIQAPDLMQGQSIVPLLDAEQTPAEQKKSAMYYHYYEFGPPHWVAPHYGIRTERYKLISYYERNEWELFDLLKDPDEMENLIIQNGMKVQPGYEAVVQDLSAQLARLREKYKDTTGRPVELWLDGD